MIKLTFAVKISLITLNVYMIKLTYFALPKIAPLWTWKARLSVYPVLHTNSVVLSI